MKTYPLTITTPKGDVFAEAVTAFSVRGVEGDLCVLAGHTPFVTVVKDFACSVTIGEDKRTAHTSGGVLTVTKDGVRYLTDSFVFDE